MECLKNKTIQEYIDKSLNRVERSITRDHLIVCEKCRAKYEQYKKMEKLLINPVYKEPPAKIEKFVMNRLFSKIPTYSSIFALIFLSFIFLYYLFHGYIFILILTIIVLFRHLN
jgi:predicted anti-sigma-YlaC factor YlaD